MFAPAVYAALADNKNMDPEYRLAEDVGVLCDELTNIDDEILNTL